ncbi:MULTISPECIES: site-specific integrase [Lactiplantibacillus]|uniref:Prophage Lp3 protein 1, integrase [Lactobacillus plantarum JDM1] n=1 Tax=Lactiplantibacillus mudanjiangensis TaxID=1296538 RepID=A0A660DUC8_9LACO|nr:MULTISPECIES: site-specific integrase [Lactiplantibacillus]QCS75776.1 site-specific integrase [Lactiplantibacillus plantarum subsp. plantarum]VDG22665.1 prophage Lp3 protein 1, integrase [Lactobacillus plantarum JDM1] [Lactiplantibacillus mudanjiangensis]VDG26796.1 prophage Lp3 protein 1, integrase [Lactobacillus plantarum JDM1] [Lactiplantibacillus mudanjiangensis]
MATIKKYQDKDGNTRYQFQVYLGVDPQTGKKKSTRRRGFKSKSAARIALSRIEVELQQEPVLPVDNNILFVDVYHEWYDQYINTVRESTWARTAGMFDNHILPLFGNKRLRTITVNQCQRAVNLWFKEVTYNYKRWYNYLVAVFEYGLKHGYITHNPARMITMPVKPDSWGDKPDNFWDRDQLKTFFNCIDQQKEPEKYCLFRVLAFAGVRRGECLALTWQDIDFVHKTLRVNKTLTQGKRGKQIIQAPKTKKGRRTVSLDNTTVEILQRWHKRQREYYLFLGFNTLQPDQLVFANTKNGFKSLNTPGKWLKRIITDYHLTPSITIHGFRHSHASALFAAGATIKEVQTRLGHEDVATTLNVYTHVTKGQNQQAANKLANYLGF